MPPGPPPLRDARRSAAAVAAGVTRVARLTGLDRIGVEVAAAIRPGGHVLQVTNGKGERFEEAAAGAVLEAVELWAAERPPSLVTGTPAEMRSRFGEAVIAPADLAPPSPGWDQARIAWRGARDLIRGGTVLVPAHAVHCPPAGSEPLGPALVRWTSNGMGAHPVRAAALVHALLEVLERDRLSRALPEGFTEGAIRRRLLDPRTLVRAAPRTAAWVERIQTHGFRVYLFDLSAEAGISPGRTRRSSKGKRERARVRAGPDLDPDLDHDLGRDPDIDPDLDLGLPCAAAVLVDREGGPVPVTAGYACRLGRDAALLAALLEAAQSRLTEIHGAREDVIHGDRAASAPLAEVCAGTRPPRSAGALPDLQAASPRTALAAVVARLRRAGLARAAACDLAAPEGIHAVKVLVPGLLLSELL